MVSELTFRVSVSWERKIRSDFEMYRSVSDHPTFLSQGIDFSDREAQ